MATKRTKKQEAARKKAVTTAIKTNPTNKIPMNKRSGGELNNPSRKMSREKLIGEAINNNVAISESDKRRINLTEQEKKEIQTASEEKALKTITQRELITSSKKERMKQKLLQESPQVKQAEQEQIDLEKQKQLEQDKINTPELDMNGKPLLSGGVSDVGKSVTDFLGTAIGKVYDLSQSVFTGGKGIEQKEAEQTLNQIESDFSADIKMVADGTKDFNLVKSNLDRYEKAITRLEETTHGLNQVNLRYFLLHGVDVEERALNAKQNLEDYKIQLSIASQRAQLAEAQLNYGA